jgi:hypothetical protein
MNEDLLIIFGAGASHDCVNPYKSQVNHDYWPPLTYQLFERQDIWTGNTQRGVVNAFKSSLLNKHTLVGGIAYELSSQDSLETFLANLKRSSLDIDKRSSVALYFYLKELFSEISSNFLGSALTNNYASLLRRLLKTKFTKFSLLTTNYDTILDTTLEKILLVNFDNFDKYLNFSSHNKIFNYLKIHGSVNWSYYFRNCDSLSNPDDLIAGQVNVRDQDINNLENATDVGLDNEDDQGCIRFPALSVPLGSYRYINPQQIDNFKNQHANLKTILVIGHSGKDNTIFELLNEIIKEKVQIFIVDKDKESVATVANTFKSKLHDKILPTQEEYNYFPGGFSTFMNHHCDTWIQRYAS